MDNQQESNTTDLVSASDLAWLAGIIEGEGSMTLDVKPPRSGRRSARFDLVICNTDTALIEACLEIIDKMKVAHYINERSQPPFYRGENGDLKLREERKSALYIHIRKLSSVAIILGQLLPYFRGDKKHKANVMMRFVTARLRKNEMSHNAPYDSEDWMTIIEFYKAPGGSYRVSKRRIKEVETILRDYTPNDPHLGLR